MVTSGDRRAPLQREELIAALEQVGWVGTEAAKLLGVSAHIVYLALARHKIDLPSRYLPKAELLQALKANHWVITRTAQALGVDRQRIYSAMRHHGIPRQPTPEGINRTIKSQAGARGAQTAVRRRKRKRVSAA